MKRKQFEIPVELMAGFAEQIGELELKNSITGADDENILIDVYYEPNERQEVFSLMEWVDDNTETDDD